MSTQPTDQQLGLDAFAPGEFPEPDEDTSEPWDDRDVLDALYNDRGLSTREIAHDEFDGDVSHERIRLLLHEYDLMGDSNANLASRLSKMTDTNDTPPSSTDYEKYTLAGQGQPNNDRLATDGGRR